MKAVVTGAGGHVGASLVRALLESGTRVRAVDLRRTRAIADLDVEFVAADVADASSLDPAFAGADIVYHLAARISVAGDPTGEVWATNVGGVRNVAEAVLRHGVRRLVHCSSVHAFDLDRCGELLTEASPRSEDPGLPAYDRSKAAGEVELRRVIERGLDAVIVNPTGVIGPFDFGPSRMGHVFLALARGKLPALVSGGFDWVDVRDLAVALIAAAEVGRTGENYLTPGSRRTISELAALAATVTGTPAPRLTVSMPLAKLWEPVGTRLSRGADSPLIFTSESLHALETNPKVSGDKAMRELGYAPRPVLETVRDLYEWFADAGML